MKKFLSILVLAIVCLVPTACSHSDSPAQVAQKIAQGQTLTQDDYTVMINYCGHFAEEAQKLQDKIDNLPVDDPEAVKATDQIASMQSSSEYLTPFYDALSKATQEQVGEKNVRLIDQYAGYMWFDAPDWAVIVTDPDVAGIIVDDTADTTGVIAQPTGQVVGQ